MKSFAKTLVFLILTFTAYSKCDDGCSYINSADEFDLSLITGEWFTIMRWKNGPDAAHTCTKTVVAKDFKVTKIDYLPEGKEERVSGSFNTSALCKSNLIINWPPNTNIPSKVVVIYSDYENVGIIQACFKNTGKILGLFLKVI